MATTSFQRDIMPLLSPWREQMIWRFDLTSYDHVKGNAETIWEYISSDDPGGVMPPPPYPALTREQIALFRQWMSDNCPP